MKNKVAHYLLTAMAEDFWHIADDVRRESYRSAAKYAAAAARIEEHMPGGEEGPEPNWEGEFCDDPWTRRFLYGQSLPEDRWYRRLLLDYIAGRTPAPLDEDEESSKDRFDLDYRTRHPYGEKLVPPGLEFLEKAKG